jgi:O-antigen/teichoic acid export membrane protein
MNLLTRIARDSLGLLIARIGAQVSMVIVTCLLARRLGAAGFGEYAFLAAMILVGNVLTTFGSDMYLIREIAAKEDFSELPSVLILQLVLSFLFIGLIFPLAPHLPNQTTESVPALKVYSFALIPLAFFTVFTSVLRGAQTTTSYAWLNFVLPFIQAIAIFIFIQRGTGVVMLAYLLLVVQTLGAILGGVFCVIAVPGFWSGLHFSLKRMTSLFLACLPIALITILGILYQKLSLAMLSFLGAASMVGLFSAAARVVEAARMGHVAAFTVMYPALANAGNDKLSHGTFRLSWLLLLAISAVGSILLFLLAGPLVDIFFGAEYGASIRALRILAFTLIPYTLNSYLSIVFLAKKQEKTILRVLIVSLLMLLTLNLWLIPLAGQVGAGWAVLITEIAQAVLFSLAWMKSLLRRNEALHSKGVLHELSDPSR